MTSQINNFCEFGKLLTGDAWCSQDFARSLNVVAPLLNDMSVNESAKLPNKSGYPIIPEDKGMEENIYHAPMTPARDPKHH